MKDIIYKNVKVDTEAPDIPSRAVRAVVSTESVDLDLEVIVLDGLDIKYYERNPKFLFEHDPDMRIGSCVFCAKDGDKLVADLKFDDDEFSGMVYKRYRESKLTDFSIGFLPIEVREPTEKDKEKYGDDVRRVVSKSRLIEISAVSIGANQEAVAVEIKSAIKSRQDSEAVEESEPKTEEVTPTPDQEEEKMTECQKPKRKTVIFMIR